MTVTRAATMIPGLLLVLLAATGSLQAYSLGRKSNPDSLQLVDDDLATFSEESREQDHPRKTKKHSIENYVRIKEAPVEYAAIPRGHRLEITCEVDASPPPRIYWVMGENPHRQVEQLERESVADLASGELGRERSNLVIDCVTPLDQGLIHCVGLSGDNMVISQPTVLTVLGANGTSAGDQECRGEASAPVITRHRSLHLAEQGSTIELPCEATGKPKPHVHWVNSEGKVPQDPRFDVQPSGSLVISNLRWQDMDEYKCIARSTLGVSEATSFVYPAAKSEDKSQANAL